MIDCQKPHQYDCGYSNQYSPDMKVSQVKSLISAQTTCGSNQCCGLWWSRLQAASIESAGQNDLVTMRPAAVFHSFPLVSETTTALFGFVQGMFSFKSCISLLVSGVNYGLDLVVSLHKDASRQTPFARTEGSFTVGHTVAVMNLAFTLCMIRKKA